MVTHSQIYSGTFTEMHKYSMHDLTHSLNMLFNHSAAIYSLFSVVVAKGEASGSFELNLKDPISELLTY